MLAHPGPQAGVTAAGAARPWVTVDAAGAASTVRPAVITTQGQRATVLEAPASLLATATHTLSPPGGRATTYTGLAPVASATGRGAAGAFLACELDQGVHEPFCLPRAGSVLHPGRTYYSALFCLLSSPGLGYLITDPPGQHLVTWSPAFFSPRDTPVELQVFGADSASSASKLLAASGRMSASAGFHPWTIPSDFFAVHAGGDETAPFNVTFVLVYDDPTTTTTTTTTTTGRHNTRTRRGPSALVVPSSRSPSDNDYFYHDHQGRLHPNPAVIVVPLAVFVLLVVLAAALCLIHQRRHGKLPLIGRATAAARGRSGQGYGVRKSRAERTGSRDLGIGMGMGMGMGPRGGRGNVDNKSETDVGWIPLEDRDSWSSQPPPAAATPGKNVFREELERQARMG